MISNADNPILVTPEEYYTLLQDSYTWYDMGTGDLHNRGVMYTLGSEFQIWLREFKEKHATHTIHRT